MTLMHGYILYITSPVLNKFYPDLIVPDTPFHYVSY
jgi:hypothetical protein